MSGGIVSVVMQAEFVGDATDVTDQQRIAAYGDPKVNIAGTFTDPTDSTFQFTFPISEFYTGVTTDMMNHTVRFMTSLPVRQPSAQSWNPFAPTSQWNGAATNPQASCNGQGPLDCLVTDAVRAATIWAAAIDSRVQTLMTALRAKTPAQLTSLPDSTV